MLLSGMTPNFINTGADSQLLEHLNAETPSEELVKAMNKQGLVQKEIQVRTKNGVHTRKQWVKASDVKKEDTNGPKEDKRFEEYTLTFKKNGEGHHEKFKSFDELKSKLEYFGLPVDKLADFNGKNINDNGYAENDYQNYKVCAYPPMEEDKDSKPYKPNIPDGLKDIVTFDESKGIDAQTHKYGDKTVRVGYSGKITITDRDGKELLSTYNKEQASKLLQESKSEPKKENTGHITGTTMNDLVGNLKSKGYEMDSADRRQPQDKVTLYKDGKEFTATFNKYSNGDVEVLNIKEVKSESKKSDDDEPMRVPSKLDMHIDTPTNETWFEGNINGTRVRVLQEKVGNNDWWIAEVGGKTLKDDNDKAMTFESPKDAEEEAEDSIAESKKEEPKKEEKNSGAKLSKDEAKKKTQSFTNKVNKTDAERKSFMDKVKAQGITWKENDNAGINWMRCCMALNKHFENGGDFDEDNHVPSSSDTPKSLSDSSIKKIFNENKSKLKDVIDEYGLKEDDMINTLIGAVRDYEEEMEEPMPKDKIVEMMLDKNNQW